MRNSKTHTSKKSQMTIFLILSIVLVIIVLALLYFSGSIKKQEYSSTATDTNKAPSELEPLINYIELCLDTISKQGFFVLGSQAGAIYYSQGGNILDYTSEAGRLYLEYNSKEVPYLITTPLSTANCNPTPPEYPLKLNRYYPYSPANVNFSDSNYISDKIYSKESCFGTNRLFSTLTMMEGLKGYIRQHIKTDCSFSDFKNFIITSSEPNVTVASRPSATEIYLDYSLQVTNLKTGAKTQLNKFRTTVKLSIMGLQEFTDQLINKDVGDPAFKITSGLPGYDYNVFVTSDVFNRDDIITIQSDSLELDGIPFKFVFARKNRCPILEYVYNTSFSSVSKSLDEIGWEDVIHQELAAIDPDEENATIKVFFGKGTTEKELTKDSPYHPTPGDKVNGIPVNITVSDGQYADYQVENYKESFFIK